MTTAPQRPKVIDAFTRYVEKHGSGAAAVGWGSEESQRRRFEVLAGIGDLSGKHILDVGCGLGGFRSFLKEAGIDARYTGIDITPAMVVAARQAHPDCRFYEGSIEALSEKDDEAAPDYAFASGIFCFDREAGQNGMMQTVADMFRLARVGVAFNSLSGHADFREEGEFYADAPGVLAECMKLSPWVVLRHDYHPGDFTVYIYKSCP